MVCSCPNIDTSEAKVKLTSDEYNENRLQDQLFKKSIKIPK